MQQEKTKILNFCRFMGRNDTSREIIRYIFISFQDNTEEHKLILDFSDASPSL